MRKNILITGMPRVGKSTLISKIIERNNQRVGVITTEIRKCGERVGFEVQSHIGEKYVLAHVDFKTNLKVSKYFIDINNLNKIIPKVSKFSENDLLFLDEIGQMQLFSEEFKILTKNYLDSPNICIATLSKIYCDDFIESIKKRKDIFLIEITENNRIEKEKYIESLLGKIVKAKKYAAEPERFLATKNNVIIKADHGKRILKKEQDNWTCDCSYFQENLICSHAIAVEEYLKNEN